MGSASDDLARGDTELSGTRGRPRVDPGLGAVFVAVGVLLLLGTIALPWVGPTTGWAVLLSLGAASPGLGVLPRLFALTVTLFGVLGSAAALITRLWALGWTCALGCGFSVITGLWAVWSRQTAPAGAPGPGIGLVLTLVAMVLVTALWVRIAWTRPGGRAGG